jgi:asparagine synthase (glutamine-hydrolysing)
MTFNDGAPGRRGIAQMCGTMVHRGPDDEGIYTAPHIGLGQRRLSIIDLRPIASPPLSNEDGTVWVVLNGEVYNFKALREALSEKGHHFRTGTDTEVIVHLYEDYGTDCLNKLRGMFAFALWDSRKKQLFCARDRLGKKPFCYTKTSKSFIFGSEIKAITADPEVTVEPDYHAIDLYLTYQFVPSPYTAFMGIRRLAPGEFLTCDVEGNVTIERYWEPPTPAKTGSTQEEIEDEVLRRLSEAVEIRMAADVPLGAFLSGGIDSSTIVALMAQKSLEPVKTFSIGFEEASHNELPYARLVAERYGTEHHELIVRPKAAEVLPILVEHYNEPFADSSALPTYYVSKATRDYVTVALSGDGGDESFGGYLNYKAILGWGKWDGLPFCLRNALANAARRLLHCFPDSNLAARIRRGFGMLGARDVRERRLQYGTILKPEEKRLAYTPLFKALISESCDGRDPLSEYGFEDGTDELDWLMRHDLKFYLPDCLMVKTDIASMANSLEVRCPFLDHELVEYAASIPSAMKMNSAGGKTILKRAVKDLIPAEILGKRKSGFAVPIGRWFRKELSPLLKENLLDEVCTRRGLLGQSLLRKMIWEHIEGKRDWSNRLWAFLFLELWFREYIK